MRDRQQVARRRRSGFPDRLVGSAPAGSPARVIDDMRRAILSGDVAPGTLIPIDMVAEVLGVSAIPVREALKVLIGEGLVDHVPREGYSVATLTFAEFRELYDVRRALEAAALAVAVERATEADLERAREAHEEMVVAGSAADDRAYAVASRRFHLALIEPAGMPRLLHMYESTWNLTEPTRPMARVDPLLRARFVDDHVDLLDALAVRDGARLVALSDQHYEHLQASFEAFAEDAALFRVGGG